MIKIAVIRGKEGVYIPYIEYGTIGWLKTMNGEVRQCKCVGFKFVENFPYCKIQYKWSIAGIAGKDSSVVGTESRITTGADEFRGIIYSDFNSARFGRGLPNVIPQENEMLPNAKFYVAADLVNRYHVVTDNIELKQDDYGNKYLNLFAYGINKDRSVTRYLTGFDIVMDKNGIRSCVPMLDGRVDGIHRYATKESAYAAIEPIKVYTFDEEEPTDTDDDTLCITIKIKSCDLNKISDIAEFLEHVNR